MSLGGIRAERHSSISRNGQKQTPLANGLFPGDLVTFSVGDRIPADIRLISAVQLEVDESALTGETRPARKNTDICSRGEGEDTHGEGGGKALGERHCMVFMGTLVRSGELRRDFPTQAHNQDMVLVSWSGLARIPNSE